MLKYVLLIISICFFSLNVYSNDHDLYHKIIVNKASYDADATQIEFLVLMGRMLNYTNDLAKEKIIISLKDIPQWAEIDLNYVQNKFGQLDPYYLQEYSPNSKVNKNTVIKFLTAYLEQDNTNVKKNSDIRFQHSFFNLEKSYQLLIDQNVLSNNSRSTLTKNEIVEALIVVSELKKERYNNVIAENKKNIDRQDNSSIYFGDNKIDLSVNGGMSNLYIWRGMNQANSGNSAFYGGIDSVTNDSFSFGTWASNVGFSDDTSYEWDIYAAYFGKLPFFQSYNYEIGYTYYSYPDAINPYGLNFSEAYIGLSTDSFALRYNYLMSGPDNAAAGLDTYLNFSYTKSLHNDFSFIASVGFYSGSVVISGDQTDYMVGLSKNNFTFSTVGTNKPEYSPKVVIQYELNIL